MNAIGARLAAAYPESHQHVRSRVLPYARAFLDSPQLAWMLRSAQFLVGMLLVVIGMNVAILVYARTATRTGEIAVRSALGASRARIVAQLFVEALVLSVVSAVLGIVGAHLMLRQIRTFLLRMGGATERLPFWMHFDISPAVVVYVSVLAVLAAVIVGIVPAIKATRRQVHTNLQQLGAGGSGMRLGRIWTLLIVAQVAVGAAALPFALGSAWKLARIELAEPAFATAHFLTATLVLDRPELYGGAEAERSTVGDHAARGATPADSMARDSAFATRFANLRTELVRRLQAEPGVAEVVLAAAVPGNEPEYHMEVDRSAAPSPSAAPAPPPAGFLVGVNRVAPRFFDTFGVPVLAGRPFRAGDYAPASAVVIVNQSFVRELLGGGSPLGRRVRWVPQQGNGSSRLARPAPWEEIVGVVPDFPNPLDPTTLAPRMYRPLRPADAGPVTLAIRVRGGGDMPTLVANRVRELTVAVSPMLRLTHGVATLDGTFTLDMAVDRIALLALALLALSTLLLSAAGIYALMSFTVTRRRREIGVRLALGGQPRRILASVLGRAMGQVGIGIVIGAGLLGLTDWAANDGTMDGRRALLLLAVAAMMAIVGLVAAIGPARRALRIQPTEALKAE